MASFEEATSGDAKVGENIFKPKCAQCHTVENGPGNKQVNAIGMVANDKSPWRPDLVLVLEFSPNLEELEAPKNFVAA